MNLHTKRAACGVAAIAFGWWITGFSPHLAAPADEMPTGPQRSTARVAGPGPMPSRKPQAGWSPSNIPLEELAGIHSLPRSPTLKLHSFIDKGSSQFLNDDPLAPLAAWLELNPGETRSLREILERAAEARIAWETKSLRSERVDAGHHRIKWLEPGNELDAEVQRELAERFGDPLARSIWIRGGLDRFAEPVPGWELRGVDEIDIRVTSGRSGFPSEQVHSVSVEEMDARLRDPSSRFKILITNGDWQSYQVVAATDEEIPVSPRLRHLVQLRIDSDEFREITAAATKPTYPVATIATPGMVHSPFSGKIIDVRGIPPGTLVKDPTLAGDAIFRTPPDE